MKKVFVLLMAVFVSTNLMAQEEEIIGGGDVSYRIYVGPKIGITASTMTDASDFYLEPSMGMGFHAGVVGNIHLGRRTQDSDGGTGLFGLQVEALYSQRTIKTNVENLKFTSLEVPILAQFYVFPEFTIEAGPTFVASLSSSPNELKLSNALIAIGELKNFDMMITAGVGYKHSSGFTASARYNLGMSKLAGNFGAKVNTLTVSIGYLFSLIK